MVLPAMLPLATFCRLLILGSGPPSSSRTSLAFPQTFRGTDVIRCWSHPPLTSCQGPRPHWQRGNGLCHLNCGVVSWDCAQQCFHGPPHADVVFRGVSCSQAGRDGAQQMMESHNLSSFNQPFVHNPPKKFSTAQRSSHDHHTDRARHIVAKIINIGGCSPQAIQARILPVCKWMPALFGNVFSTRLKISRVRPGDQNEHVVEVREEKLSGI